MFDQLKAMKQLAGLMGNAGELKAKFEALQAELKEMSVDADAGAGAVRVTMNGHLRVTDVKLDPAMIVALAGSGDPGGDDTDHGMIEELIVSATNAAMTKAQEMVKEKMATLTGGMDLPGLPGMGQLLG